jgi:hypothetical protein
LVHTLKSDRIILPAKSETKGKKIEETFSIVSHPDLEVSDAEKELFLEIVKKDSVNIYNFPYEKYLVVKETKLI